jgi:hypothetical protein
MGSLVRTALSDAHASEPQTRAANNRDDNIRQPQFQVLATFISAIRILLWRPVGKEAR